MTATPRTRPLIFTEVSQIGYPWMHTDGPVEGAVGSFRAASCRQAASGWGSVPEAGAQRSESVWFVPPEWNETRREVAAASPADGNAREAHIAVSVSRDRIGVVRLMHKE